jgi:hypothetical protein
MSWKNKEYPYHSLEERIAYIEQELEIVACEGCHRFMKENEEGSAYVEPDHWNNPGGRRKWYCAGCMSKYHIVKRAR